MEKSAIRVSVALAACNGEKYIARQMESILSQMGERDELVISVDPSNDRTKQIAMEFMNADSRVRVVDGPGQGVVRNFENVLKQARGAMVFLSDQDDLWQPDKLDTCVNAMEKADASAIVHDAAVVDEDLKTLQDSFFCGGFYSGIWRNLLRNRYMGCCMAFRRGVLNAALPFPPSIPMHDQWLGMVASKMGEVLYIDQPLLLYRRHGHTVTGRDKAGFITKLRWRLGVLKALTEVSKRVKLSEHTNL